MSFEIKTIEVFDRQAKRLAKHYASFKQDYKDFLDELRNNPLAGTDLGGALGKSEWLLHQREKVKEEAQESLRIQQMSLFGLSKGRYFSCKSTTNLNGVLLMITKSSAFCKWQKKI